jgi:PKD repeat protein
LDKTRPVANAGQNQTINVGETVTFDASNSTDNIGIISYKWDFGDGATATGVTVTHAYTNPGTYTVKLTVMDKAGNIGIDSVRVIVTTSDIVPAWIKSILIVAGITFILLIVVILRKR